MRRAFSEARSRWPSYILSTLKAIHKVTDYSFLTADTEQMLAEIEGGFHQ